MTKKTVKAQKGYGQSLSTWNVLSAQQLHAIKGGTRPAVSEVTILDVDIED